MRKNFDDTIGVLKGKKAIKRPISNPPPGVVNKKIARNSGTRPNPGPVGYETIKPLTAPVKRLNKLAMTRKRGV